MKLCGPLPALLVAMGSIAFARDAPPAEKDSGAMEIREFKVPISAFSSPDPSSSDGSRKLKPGVVRVSSFYREMYDVTASLQPYGISFPLGSAASFHDNILTIRDTAPNLALAARIFKKAPAPQMLPAATITFSTYIWTPPPATGFLPWEQLDFAELKKSGKDALKLLDTISVTAGPGVETQKAKVVHPGRKSAREKTYGDDFLLFHEGETGTKLHVYQTTSPDLTDVAFTAGWASRIPSSQNGEFSELRFNASFLAWSDHPLIVHCALVPHEKGKYYVVVACPHASEAGWELPAPAPGTKPGVVELVPAPGGDSALPHLVVQSYKVPSGFSQMRMPDGTLQKLNPREFLEKNRIGFPPGSDAILNEKNSTLTIVNTPDNFDAADPLLSTGCYLGSYHMVAAEYWAYECDLPGGKPASGKLGIEELEKLPPGSMKLLGFTRLLCQSGMQTRISDIFTRKNGESQGWEPQFRDGETGITMGVDGFTIPDPRTEVIACDYGYEMRFLLESDGKTIAGGGGLESFSSKNNAIFVPRWIPVEGREKTFIVIVARMKIVDQNGREFHYQFPEATPAEADKPAVNEAVTPPE